MVLFLTVWYSDETKLRLIFCSAFCCCCCRCRRRRCRVLMCFALHLDWYSRRDGLYTGWQWRHFFIPYLRQLLSRHDVGQALRNVCYYDITFLVIYSVSTKKRPPKYNGVVFEILGNIIEFFTTEFSIYLYVVCKNLWKFNVKIIFYYMFSITRSKHKFPWQRGPMHVHSDLQWSSVIIYPLS